MKRLGALGRDRFGLAPTMQVGWAVNAMGLLVAPCTGILTCFTVRESRSKAMADTSTVASSYSQQVADCTVNKASASFKVGELRLDVYGRRHQAGAVIQPKNCGLTLDVLQHLFQVRRRHQQVSGSIVTHSDRMRRKPIAKAGSKAVFSGTENPGETHVPKKEGTGVFSNEASIPQTPATAKTNPEAQHAD